MQSQKLDKLNLKYQQKNLRG
ncbi:hypothetical protein [Pseudalkalibacillus salsuginis]